MSRLLLDITMSLDGFVAGPNQSLERPLGDGGERLHEWAYGLESFRKQHGLSGGTTNADSEVIEESVGSTGAVLMGRRMFSGGEGPWSDDPNADGWWGDTPPFGVPVFILTHHAREPVVKQGGTTFTFVTDGIVSALDQARRAAGGQDVSLAGGASAARQYFAAGLVDEMEINLAPVLLGSGERLFDGVGDDLHGMKLVRTVATPEVTHLKFARPR